MNPSSRCVERKGSHPRPQVFRHRSLLGTSLQQRWAVEAPDGQLIWVEGSVEEMVQHTDSTMQQQKQQQEQQEEVQRKCYEI